MMPRDAHICRMPAAEGADADVEHAAALRFPDGEGRRSEVFRDAGVLFLPHAGEHFEFAVGVSCRKARRGGAFHPAKAARMGDDDALDVLQDVAAHFDLSALGEHAQRLFRKGGGIGDGDGFGAAHRGHEFFFEPFDAGAPQRFFHGDPLF